VTANVMKFLSWTAEQWSYVKMRHREEVDKDLPTTASGLVNLQSWYVCRYNTHPPLSLKLEGVNYKPEAPDVIWSCEALCNAIKAMAVGGAPFPRPFWPRPEEAA
jgi:hypothetical protein